MKILFSLTYSSRWGENIYLIGNQEVTGCWQPEKAVPMHYIDANTWQVEIDVSPALEYKYMIKENGSLRWEYGENRTLGNENEVRDGFRTDSMCCRLSKSKLLNAIGGTADKHKAESSRWNAAGVAVPLFSLRTKNDFGIGEIHDLMALADWCRKCGLKVIQLLPINDTTAWRDWRDSYPYNAISAFAINPIYLNISDFDIKWDKSVMRQREKLNKLSYVNYPQVADFKWKLFRILYDKFHKDTEQQPDYEDFINKNNYWLSTYAAFCVLRDKFDTPDFSQWGEYSVYNELKIKSLVNDLRDNVGIYYFLQYHLHKQLSKAVEYVHSQNIAMKGDIAIGVSPHSAEAWSLPELFNRKMSAGAPPDAFSEDGQVWGFPTYRWDSMAADGYCWWQQRLTVMSAYFDAFRIDHILGFFRIWEVPRGDTSALLGHFYPSLPFNTNELHRNGFDIDIDKKLINNTLDTIFIEDPYQKGRYHPRISLQRTMCYNSLTDSQKESINRLYDDFFYHRHTAFWKDEAMRKLPSLINATNMMPCGEDLGMIPDGVKDVMRDLGIMSLEVQRMPKVMGQRFVMPDDVAYGSVYTTGTHDMPTLRGWISNAPDDAKSLSEMTSSDLNGDTSVLISQVLNSKAALVILPMQDFLDMVDELQSEDPAFDFINDPADKDNKWKYRIGHDLDELSDYQLLCNKILTIVSASGR